MKIGVLIKQTPDTETKIAPTADGNGIETQGIKYIISPYDEYAVEEAIKTKEKVGEAETVAVTLGPARTSEALRTALAMGIDRAIRIDNQDKIFDGLTTAKILANVIKKQGFDLIFSGKQAIDADGGQVTQMVAELTNMAHVTVVEEFSLSEDKKSACVSRAIGGGAFEVIEANLPAIIGCNKGLNTPRYASLPGIMKAKKKPLEELQASDLLEGALLQVVFKNYRLLPERQGGKILKGEEPKQMVAELVKLLHEEAKVI